MTKQSLLPCWTSKFTHDSHRQPYQTPRSPMTTVISHTEYHIHSHDLPSGHLLCSKVVDLDGAAHIRVKYKLNVVECAGVFLVQGQFLCCHSPVIKRARNVLVPQHLSDTMSLCWQKSQPFKKWATICVCVCVCCVCVHVYMCVHVCVRDMSLKKGSSRWLKYISELEQSVQVQWCKTYACVHVLSVICVYTSTMCILCVYIHYE